MITTPIESRDVSGGSGNSLPFCSLSFPSSLLSSPRSQGWILAGVIFLGTLALYLPVRKYPFINYDDDRYISDNAHVKFGLTPESMKWAFISFDESNWHPVTWLSHMLDCQIFGLNPAGPHIVNSVLHAANAAVLFWILCLATGLMWRSLMVAALFAVHPMMVESVAWVAERKNLLSLLFLLIALAAYRRYAIAPSIKRYLVVAAAFAIGLMSKPQVITLPFLLLLWDYWPLRRTTEFRPAHRQDGTALKPTSWRRLWLEKLPLFAMCIPSAILTLRAQNTAGAVSSLARSPLRDRLANAIVSYARYLEKAVWPSRLALMYPYRPDALTAQQILIALFLLVSTSLLAISIGTTAPRKRYLIVGWLWFVGALVPMIGLVQVGVQAIADRYAYLPFIGLFVAACWGVSELACSCSIPGKYLSAPSFILLAALIVVSHRQIGYWSSSLAVWSHTASVTTNNFMAEDGIGSALLDQGDLELAMPHFRNAAVIHPSDPISNTNLAFYKSQHGDLSGALIQYRMVSDKATDERFRAAAFVNMGYINRQLGNFAAAREEFESALALRPRNVRAWIGLGVASQKMKDYDTAATAYGRAVELHPYDVDYLLLAGALEQSGRKSEAEAALGAAAQSSANIAQARQFVDNLVNP